MIKDIPLIKKAVITGQIIGLMAIELLVLDMTFFRHVAEQFLADAVSITKENHTTHLGMASAPN